MKRVIYILLFLFWACSDCEDCTDQTVVELDSIENSSKTDVQLTFFAEDTVTVTIKKGDVFLFSDERYSTKIPRSTCGLNMNGCNSAFIDVIIRFIGEKELCYSFTGDALDNKKDIRSVDSYEKIREYQDVGATIEFYRYVIDSNIEQQAKPCE